MYKKSCTSEGNKTIRRVLKENNIKVVGHSVQCKMVIKYLLESKKNGDKSPNGKTREEIYKLTNLEQIENNYKRIYEKQDMQDAYIVKWKLELADQ